MKKLTLLLVLVFVASSSAVTVITTPEELQAMGNDLAGDYILGNDIDLTGLTWEAISYRLGGVNISFTGTFDGDFHVIKNFTGIDDDLNDDLFKNASLFGVLGDGGVVKNVGMTDVNVTAEDYVAALVGDCLSGGTVSKCWVESGTVTMVGGNNGGTVIGLIRAGGIVTDCYSTADLVMTGPFTAGGFAQGAWGTVGNCYFAGTLTSADGTTLIGGFVRTNAGAATSCYYDKDVAGPYATDGATQARTTAEMMTQATFVDWDFENTWFIDEGQTYPTLVPIVVDPTFPTVDAGEDMLTWSGEPVKLDPNVVNNDPCEPQAPLTYLWTANPATGVVFDPSAEVEDPNVTITKPATVTTTVSITNPGFETPVLADGAATNTPPAWTNGYYDVTAPTVWVADTSDAGGYNPSADMGYGGVAPQGDNVGFTTSYVGYDKGMNQVLSATLKANTQYDLSALVGNPFLFNGSTATADYRIELLAGGVVLASNTGPSPANDTTWKTASLTYNSGANPAQLGEALAIRLVAVDFTNGKGVDFDDVKLTAEGPAPDPYVVKLRLTVNNEGSPPEKAVADTMRIDVYDDACLAARAAGLGADNPGDFDGNCITDANDLDELTTKWLNDTGLTEPVRVQAETATVPGGDFQLYKPGTGYTVTASFPTGGNSYAQGVGDGLTVIGDGIANYSDGTSGNKVDCPGWTGPIRGTGGNDLWSPGIDELDGTTCFNAFGTWSGGRGTLIESSDSLGNIKGGSTYTLSAMVEGSGGPLVLELLAGGVALTPSSSVTPSLPTVGWQEISRTYDAGAVADYVGQPMTIALGTFSEDPNAYVGTRIRFDNVSLDIENDDANLPDVDAGDDVITWSGRAAQLDPNVVNNDTTEPQGTLTYLWTAEPNGIGDPNLDVVITGADQEDASVTVTKTAPTGDATVVTMTLAVTLPGKDPVTDTMTITVYDTACLAAEAVGALVLAPTDLDENCITNFVDFALLATTWLDDYTLTEPVAKP